MIEINKDNFKDVISDPEKLVIVDLGAEWCAPCKMMEPVIEEIASSNKDKVKVAKINVDKNQELATELSVMSIPVLILFKKGKEISRITGYNSADYIQRKIDEIL